MNRIRHFAYVLTALAASVLAVGSAPAFATVVPPPAIGGDSSAVRSTWKNASCRGRRHARLADHPIAVGTAPLAATLAAFWRGRQQPNTPNEYRLDHRHKRWAVPPIHGRAAERHDQRRVQDWMIRVHWLPRGARHCS